MARPPPERIRRSHRRNEELVRRLRCGFLPTRRAGGPCRVVGDACAPRDVEAAILEGLAASTI
jgi:hypothetical protein